MGYLSNQTINNQLLDELLKETKTPEDLFGEEGLLKQLSKRLIERMLESELSHHLGYKKYEVSGKNSGNSRNGHSKKTVTTSESEMELNIPRDREGTFEPLLVPKGQTRLPGFDEKVISLYARGMTSREIQEHLKELYGIEISPTLVSNITEIVIEEAKSWQNRPLDAVYPIIYLDALQVKIKENGQLMNKAIHLVLAVNMDGQKEVLGLWITQNEGAKFWLKVLTDLQNRGVKDIFIACCDGLTGFPDAIQSVFPRTIVQLCIVHIIRNSLKFVSYKDYKAVCSDLKNIYQAKTKQEAENQLELFAQKWDPKYPSISQLWMRHWNEITPFFEFPGEIRKAIYTTNPLESVNRGIRKVIKNRASFPNEESALKLIYMALKNLSKKWTMPIKDWKSALNRFSIMFEERMP